MSTDTYFFKLFSLFKRALYWIAKGTFCRRKKSIPTLGEYWDMLDKVDWSNMDTTGQHKCLRQNSLAYFFTLLEIAEKSNSHQKLLVEFGYYVECEKRKPLRPKDD